MSAIKFGKPVFRIEPAQASLSGLRNQAFKDTWFANKTAREKFARLRREAGISAYGYATRKQAEAAAKKVDWQGLEVEVSETTPVYL